MNERDLARSLQQIAVRDVPDTLDRWPDIRAQIEARRMEPSGTIVAHAWSRRRVIGLGSAAAVLLAAGATYPLWDRPQPASAQAILDRVKAVATDAGATGVRTYHLTARHAILAKGDVTASDETWYAGQGRQRMVELLRDAGGVLISQTTTVINGADLWNAVTQGGRTGVLHATGGDWAYPASDPTGGSVADVLARFTADKTCMVAQLHGDATVVNRTAYIIALVPRPNGCGPTTGDPGRPSASAAVGKRSPQGSPNTAAPNTDVGQVTVWVDRQTFLPLLTEVRNTEGVLLERYTVTSLQLNPTIPDATFLYTPPVGATVVTSKAALGTFLNGGDERPGASGKTSPAGT